MQIYLQDKRYSGVENDFTDLSFEGPSRPLKK
jgi:hypothetical protein